MTSSDAGKFAGNSDIPKDVLVQYVVLRRDLIETWPLGSVVAQGCHASVAVIWSHKDDAYTLKYCSPTNLDTMNKITLEVKGEAQIRSLSEKLTAGGIAHKLWIEQPENFPSCLATKPYPKSVVSSFFKKLKLCTEQSGETKKHMKTKEKNKPRISWKNEIYVKTFLEACIHQVAEYGRSGGSLKPQSWEHVMKTLKSTHNLVVDQKQMKNHYDYLKGKYQAWRKLKNHTKNFYDSSTNTFNLSEEEWDEWTKENPKAECLKTSPLTFPDLCTQLFDGVASASTNGRGSNSTRQRTIAQPNELVLLGIEEGVSNQAQGSCNPSHNMSTPGTPSYASTPSFEGDRPRQINGDNPNLEERRPTKRSRQSLNQSNNTRLEEEMSNALKLMVQKDSGPSVQECKDKLNDLGWGAQNSLHKMALGIFCESASYREAWMILEEDEIENWVLMVARKLGYMV